ncbi:MAG: hypothetical protein QOF01_465, partial [Thermomicrobiales bacterium]|nr:hypothetical protein [Thermomicrobiales bacterium]
MADELEPIELTVLGDPALSDRVSLWAFAAVIGDWVAALKSETESLSARKPAVEWVLGDLRKGSAWALCEPVPQSPEGALVAKEVQRRIIVATNHAMRGGDPGQVVHERTIAPILRLVRRVEDGAVPGFSLKSGDLTAEVRPATIDHDYPKAIARHAIGSVEGQLVAVSFAGKNSMFTVRDRITDNLVRCYFDSKQFAERVISGLLHRVAVSGTLTEQANGEVQTIGDVDAIYVFPQQADLPQPGDIM